MTVAVHIATEPIAIPLSVQDATQRERAEALLLHCTGYTSQQIKELSDTKGLPLRRYGNGRGSRYVLLLSDFRRWLEGLPRD